MNPLPEAATDRMSQKRIACRILVLNYNGRDLLERFLPSVVKSAERSRHPCGILVLDNRSSDDSVAFVKDYFPGVEVTVSSENKVLCSYNEVVRTLEDDVVILLNNDIETDIDFVDPLINVFLEKEDAFFVATYGDRSVARIRWGVVTPDLSYPGFQRFMEKPGFAFSAGVAAFDRKKFIELEGYDELFLPGICEDVDLCYRGWKKGWKGYYQPASKKFHVGRASFNKAYKRQEIERIAFRNALLFMIKNITDPVLLVNFAFMLGLRFITALASGKWFVVQGFLEALGKLSQVLKARQKVNQKGLALRDRELLQRINEGTRFKKSTQIMRKFVDFLGAHPPFQKVFFGLTFFNLRLLFPLQYLLIRELIDCKSVLDLGCGSHSMVPIIPSNIDTVGVELFKPYYEEALKKGRHKKCIHADIREVNFEEKSFDAVVLLDVLEHLSQEEGEELMKKMERWARKKVLIFTPQGFLPQDAYDGNPLMKHQSGWHVNEFEKEEYQVYGVRGFKFLKKGHGHREEEKPTGMDRLIDLTQAVTYYFPRLASQLFCVKKLDD